MPRDGRSRLRVRATIAVISSFILAGLVLGWFQIPIVSSHGMILRSQLMEGKIPRHPDDETWDKVPPMVSQNRSDLLHTGTGPSGFD